MTDARDERPTDPVVQAIAFAIREAQRLKVARASDRRRRERAKLSVIDGREGGRAS